MLEMRCKYKWASDKRRKTSIDEPNGTGLEVGRGAGNDSSSYSFGRLAAIHDTLGNGREGSVKS